DLSSAEYSPPAPCAGTCCGNPDSGISAGTFCKTDESHILPDAPGRNRMRRNRQHRNNFWLRSRNIAEAGQSRLRWAPEHEAPSTFTTNPVVQVRAPRIREKVRAAAFYHCGPARKRLVMQGVRESRCFLLRILSNRGGSMKPQANEEKALNDASLLIKYA